MLTMHPTEKGDISEAALTLRFLELGWTVLKPLSVHSRYDLVIDRGMGRGFETVQCETAHVGEYGAMVFNTRSSRAHKGGGVEQHDYVGQSHLFGVYNPDTRSCYLLSVHDAPGYRCHLRVAGTQNNQHRHVRYAKDYRI